MSERDPRVDPKPGDVLIWGKHRLRISVVAIQANGVLYTVPARRGNLSCLCPANEWVDSFADAEVIHRAEEDARC